MRTIYLRLLYALPVQHIRHDGMLHRLTTEERQHIKIQERNTIVLAVAFSVIGFLLLYLPQYIFPGFFVKTTIKIPFTGFLVHWGFRLQIYGLLLMFIEIYLLTLLNLFSVHQIAVSTGYLTENDKKANPDRVLDVLNVGLEVKNKVG